MTFETLLVMVVGIAALTGLRIVLSLIGKGHAADHSQAPLPREGTATGSRCRVVRGTGRSRNLLYFVPSQEPQSPVAATRRDTGSGNHADRRRLNCEQIT